MTTAQKRAIKRASAAQLARLRAPHLTLVSLSPEWWQSEHPNLEPTLIEIPLTLSLGFYETLALRRHFRRPSSVGGVRPFSSTELRLFAVLAVNAAVDSIVDAELTDAEKAEAAGV